MEKQDLLLLHGALGSKNQFDPLVALLENDFEIYTMDFSGHGEAHPAHEFGIITFANEVLDELAKWDIDKINIFGYSMGGYVAAYLGLFTNRINKAYTLGTKFLWTSAYAEKEVQKLIPEKIIAKVPAFAEELQTRHKANDWKELLNKTRQMMLDLGMFNLMTLDMIRGIKSDLCIGLGDMDNTVTVEETISVYNALPKGSLSFFPKTKHPIEQVNTFLLAESIKEFFK
jgi:pimeloyl-ACP methyl ester carboxylesterase